MCANLAAPFWLSLIGVGVVAATVWILRRRWQRYPFPLEARVDQGRSRRLGWTAIAGVLVASAFAPLAVALARPQEVLSRHLEHAEGVDMVVALDVSGSMAALDFQPSDRLGVAKETIGRFLDRRPHDRIGLVVFAGAAVTICPITLTTSPIISSTRSSCERFPTAPPSGSGWEPPSTASGPRRRSPRSSSS